MLRTKMGRRTLFLAATVLGLGATSARATPDYFFLKSIPIPASPDNVPLSNAGNNFLTYDIADINPVTHLLYLADRSNASVDIFNTQSLTFVGRIGGSSTVGGSIAFSGQKAANGISGPDGIVVAPAANQVFAGNGNSTLYGFTLGSNALAGSTFTGGTGRVDELAFDPTRNLVLAVNNADTPPFLSIVNATTHAIVTKITFDGTNNTPNATTGGLEAPVYDPVTDKYYVNVPQIGTSGPGAVSEIDPKLGFAVTRTFDLAAAGLGACSPTGLTVGSDGRLLVGCGSGSATVLLDPRTSAGPNGSIKVINGIGGEDQVFFNTSLDLYFTASRNDPGGPVFGVISGDGTLLQKVGTTFNDHSIASDPTNGDVFVAAGGSVAGNPNPICPGGCLLVYVTTPEPASLPLVGTALLGLLGLVGWRVRSR